MLIKRQSFTKGLGATLALQSTFWANMLHNMLFPVEWRQKATSAVSALRWLKSWNLGPLLTLHVVSDGAMPPPGSAHPFILCHTACDPHLANCVVHLLVLQAAATDASQKVGGSK